MRKAVTAPPRQHRETDVSRQRQAAAREQVIRPLESHDQHNQFAWLIAQSLIRGREGEDP